MSSAFQFEERDDGIGVITLDLPDKKVNTLSQAVLTELGGLLAGLMKRSDLRGLLFRSGKPGQFIAGADLKELGALAFASKEMISQAVGMGHKLFGMVARLPFPTVALVDGNCMGGGTELILTMDDRILSQCSQTKIALPETKIGLIPGWGGTQRLPRLVGPAKAKDLIFSGRMVKAAEAHAIGLADLVAPDDGVYEAARGLVQRYAAGPALALRAAKQAIDHGLDVDLATGLEIERVQFAALFSTEDQRAGMKSFLENGPNKATFTGR